MVKHLALEFLFPLLAIVMSTYPPIGPDWVF